MVAWCGRCCFGRDFLRAGETEVKTHGQKHFEKHLSSNLKHGQDWAFGAETGFDPHGWLGGVILRALGYFGCSFHLKAIQNDAFAKGAFGCGGFEILGE